MFGGGRRDEEKARAKERIFSLRDEFGQLRLAEGVYSSGEIDVQVWRDDIETDFAQWKEVRAR